MNATDIAQPDLDGYWKVSRRPLQILVFLTPLVLLYELAMISVLRVGTVQHFNIAHHSLVRFFDVFGIETAGWYLPGAALVVVLLTWQMLAHEPWRIDVRGLGLMAAESLLLALPLIVVGNLVLQLDAGPGAAPAMALSGETLGPAGRIAGSIGAGLYEELVFRMLLIGVIHTLLVDVASMKRATGMAIAIGVSAVLFVGYHWIGGGPGGVPLGRNVFYLLAGCYFGLLFVMRGFGIVVGAHALYDIMVVLFWGGSSG